MVRDGQSTFTPSVRRNQQGRAACVMATRQEGVRFTMVDRGWEVGRWAEAYSVDGSKEFRIYSKCGGESLQDVKPGEQ